ncbi:MAG: BlaI/MecI/CopY family transcriptional regulator [Lachnoclostridium sp.]|nr:BlaI/MecI/CopY family transcriptional regulator [Lachnoclostridium sp.]MDD7522260.1 BlaI/MecI/CopY family transcriptional regulator [Lachnoclostridium sp.]
MKKPAITLTPNELEIMELMWRENRPLSRTDIIELSPDRSWKASSIHILLNKMLDKDAIKVDGFVRTGKNYGRTYSPALSNVDYLLMTIKGSSLYQNSRKEATIAVISSLINDKDITAQDIREIETVIEAKKSKLK